MRRSETQSIGSLFQDFIKSMNLEGKLAEVRLIDNWPNVVGVPIARRTGKLLIKNKVLFVYMDSSVARNELYMLDRKSIVMALNKIAKAELIEDIIIR